MKISVDKKDSERNLIDTEILDNLEELCSVPEGKWIVGDLKLKENADITDPESIFLTLVDSGFGFTSNAIMNHKVFTSYINSSIIKPIEVQKRWVSHLDCDKVWICMFFLWYNRIKYDLRKSHKFS